MIQNVLSNLLKRPSTRPFPMKRREPAPDARGTVDFHPEQCIYCGACALKCPTDAIEVTRTEKRLVFDLFRCVGCACCAEACRHGCIQMREAYHPPVYTKPDILFQGAVVPPPEKDATEDKQG